MNETLVRSLGAVLADPSRARPSGDQPEAVIDAVLERPVVHLVVAAEA